MTININTDMIKAIIISLGITQKALAAQLGISTTWLSKVLAGKKEPSQTLVRHIAEALDVSYQEICLPSDNEIVVLKDAALLQYSTGCRKEIDAYLIYTYNMNLDTIIYGNGLQVRFGEIKDLSRIANITPTLLFEYSPAIPPTQQEELITLFKQLSKKNQYRTLSFIAELIESQKDNPSEPYEK